MSSSFGPQLPPHLSKRKRSPEDDDSAPSPPAKSSKATNPHEIDLGNSSDDDVYGPSAPAPARDSREPQKPSIGPTMLTDAAKNADEIDLSDSDSDTGPAPAMGPSIPSEPSASKTATQQTIGPSMPPLESNSAETTSESPAPAPKRTYGPSLPPSFSERPNSPPADADSDSDSDSEYGPALPSASRRPAQPLPEAIPDAPSKRDEWMLAPPTSTGPRPPDPTKLKNRSFRTGPAAARPQSSGVPSVWTETAAEKLSRLENQVLGRDSGPIPSSSTPSKDDTEQRRKIEQYTSQTRGKSLYEEKREAMKAGADRRKGEAEEDDPSKRPFDREKDMALGGRLGAAQKREFLNKAANFGDRFSKGSFL
ncbi:hypothetical protein VUR80DRAFT_635 [Thermomyces stellatus]